MHFKGQSGSEKFIIGKPYTTSACNWKYSFPSLPPLQILLLLWGPAQDWPPSVTCHVLWTPTTILISIIHFGMWLLMHCTVKAHRYHLRLVSLLETRHPVLGPVITLPASSILLGLVKSHEMDTVIKWYWHSQRPKCFTKLGCCLSGSMQINKRL